MTTTQSTTAKAAALAVAHNTPNGPAKAAALDAFRVAAALGGAIAAPSARQFSNTFGAWSDAREGLTGDEAALHSALYSAIDAEYLSPLLDADV
jgi:hypothetical protein